jgi:predicted MFS family arabinose efflux permease
MKESNLKYFILYGIVFDLMTNFYKPFSAKFLERIGGNELHISLLNSLPGIATIIAIIIGLMLNNTKSQKKQTIIMIVFSRIFILLFTFVPFIPEELRPITFVLLNFIFNLPYGIYQVTYQSFIAEIFGPKDRAIAISLRNKSTIIPSMVVTFATGFIIAKLPSTEEGRILLYQLFFIISFILGMLEIRIFNKLVPITEGVHSNHESMNNRISKVFKNKYFMGFMICSLLFHFGWQMGWSLFTIYMITNLGADEAWLSIISVASAISMFSGYSFWGKKIQNWGNPKVLSITTLGMALTPILYIISKDLYILTIMSFISGFFTAGTNTVLMSGLLEAAPDEDRPTYISVYSIFINISLAIAPLVGHLFLSIKDIYFALLMTAIFRTIGSFSFFTRRKLLEN